MKIILLGAPASGKGTLAQKLINKRDFIQFSTGDILRDNISKKTELGVLAKIYIDQGQLVPSDVVCNLVKNELNKFGPDANIIFDGFPRTISQAEFLDKECNIDLVVNLEASDDVVKNRIVGRRTCEKCKKIYNTSNYSKDYCEVCGGKLIHRDDDTLEVIEKRLVAYKNQTYPLIEYYQSQNKLITLDASKNIDDFSFLDIRR